jgi:hypothetical protein
MKRKTETKMKNERETGKLTNGRLNVQGEKAYA